MALSAMAIYKQLPKTNCGDCGFPTCMAFAMQVAAKQKALTDCPHLSEEAKAEFAEASTPPMKLVHIGPPGEGGFEIGQETVMFRHEEKFHKPPALAAKIPVSLPEDQAFKRLEQIQQAEYVRVGQRLAMGLAVVEIEGLSPPAASARVKALADRSRLPFILSATSAEAMSAAVAAMAEKRPLIYKATEENLQSFIPIATAHKVPLAVGAESLEKLADLTRMARDQGVADLILAFDGRDPARAIREITRARRAALKKNFRPLGFPALMDVSHEDLERETVLASIAVAKYAGIIMINGLDAAELLPILTLVQNIYTDPQVPNEVEAKLYEIGTVGEDSPVMFTTNFALTYFSVEGEVERSKIPSYISVVDTEGLGVLNAYAGDKISPEKVVKTLQQQKVAERVKHRKLIIPGHLPSFRAEIEETSEWKEVLIGPENASGIPMFLAKNWR